MSTHQGLGSMRGRHVTRPARSGSTTSSSPRPVTSVRNGSTCASSSRNTTATRPIIWNARFEVIDWENYATIGVGRPQELITQQTLEKYRDSLALVVGIMGQRFGSPSGKAESGTEEEFNWAMESHKATGFPEIKWFFRKVEKLELPADPDEADGGSRPMEKGPCLPKANAGLERPGLLHRIPWRGRLRRGVRTRPQSLAGGSGTAVGGGACGPGCGGGAAVALPAEFDAERYRAAVLKRFDKLNFEMLDTTGAFYSGVRLWSVFVPQSVRECHQYNPRLLEIPKEHQQRLLEAGEITAAELEEAERQADRLRQEYFSQPLRPVLDVVDEALGASVVAGRAEARDPGRSGVRQVVADPLSGPALGSHRRTDRPGHAADSAGDRPARVRPLAVRGAEGFRPVPGRSPRLARMAPRPAGPAARATRPRGAAAGRAGRDLRRADARGGDQRHPALQQRVRPYADPGDVARRGLSAAAAARRRVPSLHAAGPGRRSNHRLRRTAGTRRPSTARSRRRRSASGCRRPSATRSRSPCWRAIRSC